MKKEPAALGTCTNIHAYASFGFVSNGFVAPFVGTTTGDPVGTFMHSYTARSNATSSASSVFSYNLRARMNSA